MFEIGAKIEDGWSSDNKNRKKETQKYLTPQEHKNIKIYTQKRRGKIVTIASEINISPDSAKSMMKRLKKSLGRGGTYKNRAIEFQGECQEILSESLRAEGFSIR